jgi:hypothetical protein
MTATLFQQLGLRPMPSAAHTPEPTLIVTDVDFTRDAITGQITLDGYTVTVQCALKFTRMELWGHSPKLSDQADEMAHEQAEKQSRRDRTAPFRP